MRLAFFFSGAAALVLQVLWTRVLGHVLGASALAVSTVLTVFMGGLALGSHLGGRLAPRLQRPILAFAALEVWVGLYGLAVPTLLAQLPALQLGLAPVLGDGRWGWALVRFGLSALVLLPPTVAMGATLPILAQATVGREGSLAEITGRLYAANTFGAVAGALACGFHLVPVLGVRTTVVLAALLDLAVALGVLVLFGWLRRSPRPAKASPAARPRGIYALEPSLRVPVDAAARRRVLVVFAASGATAMALEVLWTRALGVVLGASTYAFTSILVTFLIGLAVGASVAARVLDTIRDPLRALARVQIGVGLATLIGCLLVDRLPLWLLSVTRDPGTQDVGLQLTHFGIAAMVTLPATLLLGAVFPLVLAVVDDDREGPGPLVGRAYAYNTVGAIVGSFAGGFVVLPWLGVEGGLEALALLAVGWGLFLLRGRPALGPRELAASAVAAALALLGPGWDVERWTAGMFRFYLAREVYAAGWGSSTEVVFHRDGVASTVTVGAYPDRADGLGVLLKVNGKVDASDVGDMPTQILSGLLPVLMHDDPRRALVIGYGSGVTPGALLQAPIDELWVAELEDAVYEAANRHFVHVNHRPAEDPRTHLVVDDGRNFLLTRSGTFDLIVSEPSNPWMAGAASLFTQDFFRIAARRLADDGVFLQWLQLYELSPESIEALVRTFRSVFPHVLVLTPDPHCNDTFLLGSRRPLEIRRDRIERWMGDPRIRAELARARVEDPDDLVGLYFADGPRLDALVGPGPVNTDDNALIEFAAPRDLLRYGTRDAEVVFRRFARGARRELVRSGPFVGFGDTPADWLARSDRLLRQGRLADAREHAEAADAAGEDAGMLLGVLDHVEGPDDQPVVVADAATSGHETYAEAVVAMMAGRDRDALILVEDDRDPRWEESPAHALLRGFLLYRRARPRAAMAVFERLLEEEGFVARHPEVLFYAGRTASELQRWTEAVDLLLRYELTRFAASSAPPSARAPLGSSQPSGSSPASSARSSASR